MSESTLKGFGILSLLGAIFALIGCCVPASLDSLASGNSSYFWGYWFFGFRITFSTSPTGTDYSTSFYFDIFGVLAGIMLLGVGIISIIFRGKVKEMSMEPKNAGITMLICGLVSIISIVVWINYRSFFYYFIGPGVIIGIIGSAIITIGGILALVASKS